MKQDEIELRELMSRGYQVALIPLVAVVVLARELGFLALAESLEKALAGFSAT